MLDNWKHNILQAKLRKGETKDDFIELKSFMKCISVLKTFQKAYKVDYKESIESQDKDLDIEL